MDTGQWIALAAFAITVAGVMVGVTRFLVQAPLQAKNAGLEVEVGRLKQEVDSQKARNDELNRKYDSVLQDFVNLKSGKGGVLLKNAIDAEMELSMKVLNATESSVLVPGRFLKPPGFVFLSIHGPAAPKLRTTSVPIDKGIVGLVFKTGILNNTADPNREAQFFKAVDKKAIHQTKTMLTVPLRSEGSVIGVAQFLNKADGQPFTEEDERAALDRCRAVAARVSDFVQDPTNFDVLGLSLDRESKEATILFCDLTASSTLFDKMDIPTAIRCIDEYLSRQSDIALKHGATIDKYLGDGVMLRFNVPLRIRGGDHAVRAVEAALEMRRDFGTLKESWQEFGLKVDPVFARVGLACGAVYEAIMGHPQFQHIAVIGDTVNRAANLCQLGPRDRNVVVVDEEIRGRLGDRMVTRQLPSPAKPLPQGPQPVSYEVVPS